MVSWLAGRPARLSVRQGRQRRMLHSVPPSPAGGNIHSDPFTVLGWGGTIQAALVATKSLWSFLCLQQLSGPGQVSFGFLIRRNAICHSRINEDELRAPVESTL